MKRLLHRLTASSVLAACVLLLVAAAVFVPSETGRARSACPPGFKPVESEEGEEEAELREFGEAESHREREYKAEAEDEREYDAEAQDEREREAEAEAEGEREREREREYDAEARDEREREAEAEGEREAVLCLPSAKRPEPVEELVARDDQGWARYAAPLGVIPQGAFRAALQQRQALLSAPADVAGSQGRWEPYGRGPLIANDEEYENVNRNGMVTLSGRVDSFDFDPVSRRLFALPGTGGVWMSEDMAKSWRSIGDGLPTQSNAALAWTPAGGGTLVVLSGEHSTGRISQTGLGAFWTTDLGRTWHQAQGVPDGALAFQIAVDPTNPGVVYAATSKGLYRSQDVGRSYVNVVLPTGECAGRTDDQRCLLANFVTDVVVQAPDKFGHQGGAVIAAVGWRAGPKKYPNKEPQAPWNGLYRSSTGRPGTFQALSPPGFTPQERVGRVELGVASGPDQNHDYVYAIVQDAALFNGGVPVIDAPEQVKSPRPFNTSLNGIYVSANFGDTWTKMGDSVTISENPTSGSAMVVVPQVVASYAPGVQSWYNLFIQPDPTRQSEDGIPTRLVFGLEEVWQNQIADLPQDGPQPFEVIGSYYAGTTCMFVLDVPVCPTRRSPVPHTTTHPDQHDAIFVPDGRGGVTLVVGNDGGVFTQRAAPGEKFDNTKWGEGNNSGFNTLLPYQAVMAKDGTVWFGLQDNGSGKIRPGTQKILQTFGGDGFNVAVDPDDSDTAYSETTNAAIRVTTDGGRSWRTIRPDITDAQFANPFVMDPTDAKHLMTAGRQVVETIYGPKTTGTDPVGSDNPLDVLAPTGWKRVYDLGTVAHPGNPGAKSDPENDPPNQISAIDLRGDAAYVGFCANCNLLDHLKVGFVNGLATNVGGQRPPRRMTSDGWHMASMRGLPNRMITSIAIDEFNPRTVYVTLGGYAARYVPPGSYLDRNPNIGRGHVFKSTDAGETFTDISANLPDIPATWVTLRGSQLLVATDLGVYVSRDADGGPFAVLGQGLPMVPVTSLQMAPQDPDLLVASTFGRGVYLYRFPRPAAAPQPVAPVAVPVAPPVQNAPPLPLPVREDGERGDRNGGAPAAPLPGPPSPPAPPSNPLGPLSRVTGGLLGASGLLALASLLTRGTRRRRMALA